MSYTSYVYGSIQIDPPLNSQELLGYEKWTKPDAYPLRLATTATMENSIIGVVHANKCSEIIPWDDGIGRSGVEDLNLVLGQMIDAFPDHKFSGTLLIEGEAAGDIWRLRVIDNEVIKEHVKICWPDGTTTGLGQ